MATGTFVLGIVAAALAVTLVALVVRDRRRLRLFRAAEDRRLTQIGDLERAERDAESSEGRARTDLQAELTEHLRLVRDRDVALSWVRKLRAEVAEAHRRAGVIGDAGDPYALVLQTAVNLLGAEKGLLLAHTDEDRDGDLDLVCATGFVEDPEHSALVQQLARRTLSAQETLRVDDPNELTRKSPQGADAEIDNLVAVPVYILDRFHGVVVAANKPGGFHEYDDEVLLALGDQAGATLHNARLHGRLRNAYVATVRVLADAIEAKDPFLRGHSDQVSDLVAGVARRLSLAPKEREELIFASLLHDIGKIGISEQILLKPTPLTPEERSIVQLHPRIGYRLVEQIPDLRPIALAILHHHERFDGDGYPAGLRRDQIPREARVIAIADAFSAMISERPYGERLQPSEACEELKRCAGTQFDPELVELFCDEVSERGDELTAPGALEVALDDPELAQHRHDGDGLLGLTALTATDSTTLVYSHSHLQREAQSLARAAELNGRPFSVVAICVSELERVNRTEGYAAGDAMLRSVALAAEALGARVDGLAARLSGAWIALLLPGMGEDEARLLAEQLEPPTSITVHVAGWRPGESGEQVIARARAGSAARSAAAAD